MRRQIQLVIIALGLMMSLHSPAQTIANPQDRFEVIYKSMAETINSRKSLPEKLKLIKELNSAYLKNTFQMMDDAKTHPEILESAEYIKAWDLYLRIIPLLEVRLNAKKNKVDRLSCLEASSLVRASSPDKNSHAQESTLGGLGIEDDLSAQLLAKLCK